MITLLLAWRVLHEPISPRQIIATVLAVAALVLLAT
jgi:drug/metabolite transporter (DMT)-like permease